MPCVKAIPHLTKLQNNYQNVKILAINSNDNHAQGLSRLPDFIRQHNINFDIILSTSAYDKIYNVKVYPTIYVIDKNGIIAYSQVGFSEDKTDALDAVIKRLNH